MSDKRNDEHSGITSEQTDLMITSHNIQNDETNHNKELPRNPAEQHDRTTRNMNTDSVQDTCASTILHEEKKTLPKFAEFLDLTQEDIELNFKTFSERNQDKELAKKLQKDELKAAKLSGNHASPYPIELFEISSDEEETHDIGNQPQKNAQHIQRDMNYTGPELFPSFDVNAKNSEKDEFVKMSRQIEEDERLARQLQEEEEKVAKSLRLKNPFQNLLRPDSTSSPKTTTNTPLINSSVRNFVNSTSSPNKLPTYSSPLFPKTNLSSINTNNASPFTFSAASKNGIASSGLAENLNRKKKQFWHDDGLKSNLPFPENLPTHGPNLLNSSFGNTIESNESVNTNFNLTTPSIFSDAYISSSKNQNLSNPSQNTVSSNQDSKIFKFDLPNQSNMNSPFTVSQVADGFRMSSISSSNHAKTNATKNIASSKSSTHSPLIANSDSSPIIVDHSTPLSKKINSSSVLQTENSIESNISVNKKKDRVIFSIDSDSDVEMVDAESLETKIPTSNPSPFFGIQPFPFMDGTHYHHPLPTSFGFNFPLSSNFGYTPLANGIWTEQQNKYFRQTYSSSSSINSSIEKTEPQNITKTQAKEEIKALLKNVNSYGDHKKPHERLRTPSSMKIQLLPHQQLGVEWMLNMEKGTNKGGILADDMGLGKTVQSIGIICANPSQDSSCKTTLIVAPLSLISQWQQEIIDKTHPNTFKVYIYHGAGRTTNPKVLSTYDIVLTTYNLMAQENPYPPERKNKSTEQDISGLTAVSSAQSKRKRNSETDSDSDDSFYAPRAQGKRNVLFEVRWHRIILDEAHIIKNKSSLGSLSSQYFDAKFRWCLTGTPIQNTLDEFYPLIRFLKIRPYNNWQQFKSHISDAFLRGKHKNAVRRVRLLLKACMLRRTKNYTIDGQPIFTLPQKHEHKDVCFFSLPEKEFYDALYEKAQLQFNQYLREGTVMKNYHHVLSWVLRLRQACCHPNLVTMRIDTSDDNSANANSSTSSSRYVRVDKLSSETTFTNEVIQRVLASDVKNEECSICFDVIQNGVLVPICAHAYCRECLTAYYTQGDSGIEKKCPQCRGPLNMSELVSIDAFLSKHAPAPSNVEEPNNINDDANELLTNFQEKVNFSHTGIISSSSVPETTRKSMHSSSFLKREREKKAKALIAHMTVTSNTPLISSTKIDKLIEIVNKIRSEGKGEKLIVFSQFIGFLDMIEVPLIEEGHLFVRYDGSMDREERANAIKQFTEDSETNIILISLKCGSLGLNLTHANHVVLMDVWWNPAVESQAVDRTHRFGQTREVHVHKLTISGTVEDRILELQKQKQEMIDAALDSGQIRNNLRLSLNDLMRIFDAELKIVVLNEQNHLRNPYWIEPRLSHISSLSPF